MASGLRLTVLCLAAGLWFAASAHGEVSDVCETCPADWINFEESCYQFYSVLKNWADAERHCTTVGGNLASVHTEEEYDFLRNTVHHLTSQHTTIWLGGYDAAKEGVWLWSDGSYFDFEFWAKGEPNNAGGGENCMQMNYDGKDFVNDIPCDLKMSFFCEKQLQTPEP